MAIDDLIQRVTSYTRLPETETVLTSAYEIAERVHRGFQRLNDEPVISLSPPAVPGFPVGLGHPDTHRTRIGSRSPLAAIGARHTAGRDAAWHGPPGSDGALEPKAHQVS